MPAGPLAHVALLVRDLDQAVEDWKRILSVLDPSQVAEPVVYMDRFGPETDPIRWATFASTAGAEIQLIEPLGDDGPRARRLAEEGECVDHICFVQPDLRAAMDELSERGVELATAEPRSDPRLPWLEWAYVTKEAAHGVPVEVAYEYRPVDGRWEKPDADTSPAS